MKNIFLFATLLSVFAVSSCKKEVDPAETDDHHSSSASLPVINLPSPTEDQVILFNDTLFVKGNISSSSNFHGYEISLKKVSDNSDVFYTSVHDHVTSYTFDEAIKNTLTDTTELVLTINVAIDHDGNVSTKKRNVTFYP